MTAGDTEQPLIEHLLELRRRLLLVLAGVGVVFVPLAVVARQLFDLLARPMMTQLAPAGGGMIATEVASPFLAPFKFALLLSVVIALPWSLYQVWAFVAPGLYRRERRLVVPLLVTSTALFYLGMAFAYFVVFPLMFRFFVAVAPAGVTVMTDISHYLNFVLGMFMAFGAAFETPVAIVLIVWTGFVSTEQLGKYRGYVLIAGFVAGMLLTPDVMSQTMLAIPIYLLYEIGLWMARWMVPGAGEPDQQEGGSH